MSSAMITYPFISPEAGDSTDLCFYNIKLEQGTYDCGTAFSAIYFDAEFGSTEREVTEEYMEDGFGREYLVSKTVRYINSFSFVTNEEVYRRIILAVDRTERLKMTIYDGQTTYTACITRVQVEKQDLGFGALSLTINFLVDKEDPDTSSNLKNSDFPAFFVEGIGSCCTALYTEAPYEDPCTHDPLDPIDCSAFVTQIAEAGGVLSVSVGSNPDIAWYFKKQGTANFALLTNNASSVSLGDYGTYRAIASEDGCTDMDEYLYLDPCFGYKVTIRKDNDDLVAEPTQPAGNTFEWYEWNDGTETWDLLGETSAVLVPQNTGKFKVKISNTDGCEAEDVIDITIISCAWTAQIGELSGVLEVQPDTAGNYTYDWKIDRADGSGFVSLSNTTQFQNLEDSGLYKVEVQDDNGCSVELTYLYINCGTACDNLTITINKAFGDLTATVTPVPAIVEFTWFYWGDGEYGFKQVATGQTINVQNNGIYKVRVKTEDCVKYAIISVNDCN